MKGRQYLAIAFFLLTTGGTIFMDLRIRNKFIVPSTQLALVNARMIDEKNKEIQEKERRENRSNDAATSSSNKPHVDILEHFSYDPKCGDSIGFIPPSLHGASEFDSTKDDYIYTQPELDINKWEIRPQCNR